MEKGAGPSFVVVGEWEMSLMLVVSRGGSWQWKTQGTMEGTRSEQGREEDITLSGP